MEAKQKEIQNKFQQYGLGLKIFQEITAKYDGNFTLSQEGSIYEAMVTLKYEKYIEQQ